MADVPGWASGVDVDRPSAARMYDYALGGSHNFAADREAYAAVVRTFPDAPLVARSNRLFLHRAVRHIQTEFGINQFLDLGSGVPTVGNVHEIAQHLDPRARVVYVDIDPVAVAHAEMLLADNPGAAILRADVRDPASVLGSEQVAALLDLSRPVAVLMVTVLHFIRDDDDPAAIVAAFRDATAAGSAVAVSHLVADDWDDESRNVHGVYDRTSTGINPRTREGIAGLLEGYTLVEPGLVHLPSWRPDPGSAALDPLVDDPRRSVALAAVGRR
ncbi:SAM-dependent methyltransferase [Frankia sp. Ag45/Mut15]|uniref:SAM-dependent methyltransferase n=1 Tax=Frankia umida TaxID=573489 RepID=A0ABT0K412_9ACTN|nr:SAM-dependent methyltransferase [Frankia umida]MCK9878481.1 SAM-dependent methyltransferase [Frankia umida]